MVEIMLKVISFDVAETLIDLYYLDYVWNEVIPQLYAEKEDLSFNEAKDYVLKEYDRVGKDDVRWYIPEYWFNHLKLDEEPIEVFKSHADKISFFPEVPTVLENWSQKYELIIASGIPRNIIKIIIERFKHHFKDIFSSISSLNEVKKTSRFYNMICESLNIEPSSMVHIGDDYHSDFISPRKIGVQSFLLDRKGKKKGEFTIKDLRELKDYFENS